MAVVVVVEVAVVVSVARVVARAVDWFPSCVVQYSTLLLGKLFWVVSNLYF